MADTSFELEYISACMVIAVLVRETNYHATTLANIYVWFCMIIYIVDAKADSACSYIYQFQFSLLLLILSFQNTLILRFKVKIRCRNDLIGVVFEITHPPIGGPRRCKEDKKAMR